MGSNQSGEGSRDKAPAPQTNTTARSLEPLDAEEQAAWLQTSAQSLQRNGEPRTVTLSRTLTQLCEACGGLLEIQDDEDAFQMHEAPISELNKQSKAHSTSAQAEAVQLPGVPAHITAEAIQLLEKWASLPQRQPRPGADALAEWLYRATRSGAGWNALLCAADFLGCNEFLNVATDASLLFLRSMGKISLQKLLTRQQPPHAVQFGDHVHFADLNSLASADAALETAAGPSTVIAAADAHALSPTSAAATSVTAAAATDSTATAAAPAQRQRVSLSASQLHALVRALDEMRLLPVPPSALMSSLARLRMRATLHASWRPAPPRREAVYTQADEALLTLWLPAAALAQPGVGSRQQLAVARLQVEATAHDQGWSDFHADHGTYNNSWTFGDLVIHPAMRERLGPCASPGVRINQLAPHHAALWEGPHPLPMQQYMQYNHVQQQLDAQPADRGFGNCTSTASQAARSPTVGESGEDDRDGLLHMVGTPYRKHRVYTNKHAVQMFQAHLVQYTPGSDVLQALEEKLQEAAAAVATAAAIATTATASQEQGQAVAAVAAAGALSASSATAGHGSISGVAGVAAVGHGGSRSCSSGSSQTRTQTPSSALSVGSMQHEPGVVLELRVRALFPGWAHHVRSAALVLELMPQT